MFKNYLIVAIHNLLQHKAYTVINVVGLAIGLTCGTLILLYLQHEFSYDRHHSKADRIYRTLPVRIQPNGDVSYNYATQSSVAPQLAEDFPEIERATRFMHRPIRVGVEGKESIGGRVTVADPEFFHIFDFPLIQGDARTGLQTPFSIFVTQRLATSLFGDTDPIGKTVFLDSKFFGDTYTITGILKDIPRTSIFDLTPSLITTTKPRKSADIEGVWSWWDIFYTYILLKPNASLSVLENKLPNHANNHLAAKTGQLKNYKLLPLTEVHLHGRKYGITRSDGDINTCYTLGLLGIVIVVVACINFMNLSTARSARRMREVGMRKVVGAKRTQLVYQFLCESVLLSILSLILSLGLTQWALPTLNNFMQIQIVLNTETVPALFVLGISVGILAGSYPAFFMSSIRPIAALTSMRNTKGGHAVVRKGLVVAQFAISIILIIGTLTVFQQTKHMRTINLGFNKDALITTRRVTRNVVTLKNQFRQLAGVKNVTLTHIPIYGNGLASYNLKSEHINTPVPTNYLMTDPDFLNTYEIPLLSGRQHNLQDFSTISGAGLIMEADRNILLNETAAKKLDVQTGDLIQVANPWDSDIALRVVGIFKDFHHTSLHHAISPLMLLPVVNERQSVITMRIDMQNLSEVLTGLEKTWKKYEPNNPITFIFMDEARARRYEKEQKLSHIYALSSGLAIAIACLGLLGLIAYTAEVRTKEIGIRKILGATENSIVRMLTKEFLLLVALASLLAYPIAYYTMNSWLQNFAYRIDLNPAIFALSTVAALTITLLTISYQAIKAARTNPIESLRHE